MKIAAYGGEETSGKAIKRQKDLQSRF